jgi:capsular exopolysaccharide synthesis family protein
MDTTEHPRSLEPGDGDRLKRVAGYAELNEDKSEQGLDLSAVINIIRRRRSIILACMAVITVAGAAFVFQLTPRYTAETSILLDQRKTQVTDMQSVISGLPADAAVLHGEMEVIKSSSIAEDVVKKTNLVAVPEFNARLQHPSLFGIMMRPVHWAVFSVKSLFVSPPNQSDADADPAHAEIQAVALALQGHLDIFNDGRSYVLKIRVESEDPGLAARLANAYADAYLNAQLDAKFQAVQRANTWLNDHLSDLQAKTEAADRAVQEFAAANNLTQTASSNITSQQVSELNSQLVLASADLAQKEANLQQVQDSLKTGGVSAAAQVMSSPLILNLREQETVLITKEADLATRYKPEHPAMINIKAQERDLDLKIQDEINRIVRGMDGDVATARAKLDSLRQSMAALQTAPQNDAQVQLHELQREADANRTLYEDFLNRFKQTTAQEDIQEPDARIISEATVPSAPSYPKKLPLIGFAFLGSFVIGGMVAFGMERLDVGFRTGEQFERLVHVPVLGLEPALFTGEEAHEVVVQRPVSSYSESIRSIRTALRYSDVDNPPKVIMVTSSLPDEGKTVFALSLARSVAKSGGKALLIDCDLRRPSIAKQFGVESNPGLLAFFDDAADKSKIICIDAESGLHYIPTPSGTPNPQDLLGSKHMKALIDVMRERYDLIVLDTPPLLAVSDPLVLSHSVDATVFLVRWARTPRQVVLGAMKSFRTLGGKLAGVVLSRVDMRQHATYGYGDPGYYYGYYGRYSGYDTYGHNPNPDQEWSMTKTWTDLRQKVLPNDRVDPS